VLLVFGTPCQLRPLAGPEHGRTIPLADIQPPLHPRSIADKAVVQWRGNSFLYAFDLIELNGDDLRRDPLEVRKATLASIVAKAQPGSPFNEHMEGDGPTVLAHACKLVLEGIVSKRKDSV